MLDRVSPLFISYYYYVFLILFLFIFIFIYFEFYIFSMTLCLLGSVICLCYKVRKLDYSYDYSVIKIENMLNLISSQMYSKVDLKELKRNGHPLFNSLKNLIASIQSKDIKIEKNTKKLHEKNMQNMRIISSISHEIKNPLSIIEASIQTIQRNPKLDSNMLHKMLANVIIYSKKITNFLDRLNISSSLEHDIIKTNFTHFDIYELAFEIIEGFKLRGYKKKMSIKGNMRNVYADRLLIEHVFNNLIHNAVKYSKSKINLEIKKDCIEIVDDGNGVLKSDMKQIIKKFYSGKNAIKSENSLGLGLFIVSEILKIHNKNIEFSNIKNGFKVKILL